MHVALNIVMVTNIRNVQYPRAFQQGKNKLKGINNPNATYRNIKIILAIMHTANV